MRKQWHKHLNLRFNQSPSPHVTLPHDLFAVSTAPKEPKPDMSKLTKNQKKNQKKKLKKKAKRQQELLNLQLQQLEEVNSDPNRLHSLNLFVDLTSLV